jgi:type IV secretory pathway VirB2 component (pilin)
MRRVGIAISAFLMAAVANASGAGDQPMPWEGPLQKIMHSISGPVAQTLGVIVIVLAGLGIAFGESGSGVRKILMVVCGLAIAFTASSIVASLYNPSSGLSF